VSDLERDALQTVIRERASVRAFASEPIDIAIVERAIEAAGWAPSPHGTQPWRFVVLDGTQVKARLASAMAAEWRRQLELDTADSDEIERRLANSVDRLDRAPVVVIACLYLGDAHKYPDPARQQAERLMAVQSLGAAAQNFLLTLHAEGIAAGWMCAPLFCPEVIQDVLRLPNDLEPQAMFPVGLMASPPRRRPRRAVDSLIFRAPESSG
jgi:coenzyme F420-0:L-glutamate ligase / coenzyme F420-1:gamma-L-glutamate ligase